MNITTNIMGFYQDVGLERTIEIFAEAGFHGIEFNNDRKEFYTHEHDRSYYEAIRQKTEALGLSFPQAHMPFPSSGMDADLTRQRFYEITDAMEYASWLGVKIVVVHPCGHLSWQENWDAMMEYNVDFYRRLAPYAKKFGLQIAIENINGTVTRTADGMNDLLDRLNDPVFVVCYDVGHAHIAGQGAADMLRKIGNRVKCTHIHDNDGVHDTHTLPYYGTIDWDSVMEALADIGYEGNLNYEAGNFVANTPSELKPMAAKFMMETELCLMEKFKGYCKK